VEAQLRAGWFSAAAELVANLLLEKDLTPDDGVVSEISRFLDDPTVASNRKTVLQALGNIKINQERPEWAATLKNWWLQFGSPANDEPNKTILSISNRNVPISQPAN
jgi:hypothetical protein